MIHNDEQLAIYKRQLGLVDEIVESWRQQLLPHNPKNFAIYAESAIAQADILRAEIDEYLAQKKAQAPEANGVQTPVGQDPTTVS
jgi:hypothetical protein